MLKTDTDLVTEHAFASRPLDWPLMRKGVAYWMANDSNVSKFPRTFLSWDFFISTGIILFYINLLYVCNVIQSYIKYFF